MHLSSEVYACQHSKCYHYNSNCPKVKTHNHKLEPIEIEDAINRGLVPCYECMKEDLKES